MKRKVLDRVSGAVAAAVEVTAEPVVHPVVVGGAPSQPLVPVSTRDVAVGSALPVTTPLSPAGRGEAQLACTASSRNRSRTARRSSA